MRLFALLGFTFTGILLQCIRDAMGICYFPEEFQGEFVMQSTVSNVGSGIQYAALNITPASIYIWGNCERRIKDNFILVIEETLCVRCLHLKLKSSNVLQVFAKNQDAISNCYVSKELAEANCPNEELIKSGKATETLLFKTRDVNGIHIKKTYCPIDGKYFVKYKGVNNRNQNVECEGYDTSMDTCPSGSTLNFRLLNCFSENYAAMTFDCMGDWKGPNGQNYLIFKDNRPAQRIRYRCALYSHNYRTGEISMSLSADSTCTNGLNSSSVGYETFMLSLKSDNPWPAEASVGMCSFPKWVYGTWSHMRGDDDTIIYRDYSSFKTYTIKCVAVQENQDKFLIFSRTQCDEERFNCMRLVKRSSNIIEMQISTNSSSSIQDVFVLCADENFQDNNWITQGRVDDTAVEDPAVLSPKCPITGVYMGVIPDSVDMNLCAKLWSACDANTDRMYYQVFHCATHEVYEEREYKCLGHWREAEYLYTYTERQDVAAGTYECFVGVKVSPREIYIKEAGEHCQRHMNPLRYGMQLNQTEVYTCEFPAVDRISSVARTTETVPTGRNKKPVHTTLRPTTKVWNFDTEGVETNKVNSSSADKFQPLLYLTCFLVIISLKSRK